MKIYTAIAYRYGWTNNGWYFAYVGMSEDNAVTTAEEECEGRGGKYGIQVVEYDGDKERIVGYFPSAYGEEKPHENHRIHAAESIGLEMLTAVEDGQRFSEHPTEENRLIFVEAEVPQWIKERVEHHLEISKILCAI